MSIDLSLLIGGILATYCLTYILSELSGPKDILTRFRTLVGVRYDEHSRRYGTWWGAEAIICFYCASVWLGALVALLTNVPALYLFAFSGGAMIIKKAYG